MMSTDTAANVTDGWGTPHRTAREEIAGTRGAALACVAVYLLASGLLLAIAGRTSLVLVHAALLGVIAVTVVPRSSASRFIGDVLPLIAMPALYAEIPALIAAAGTTYHDAWLQTVELALFHAQPSRELAHALPFIGLSEILHAGYLSYYPLIFAPPLALLFRGERRGFAHTVLALAIVYALCWLMFVFFPVEGPRFLWGPADAPDGPVRRLTTALLAAGSSRGAAFPSSHMAVSVTQAMLATRWQPRVALAAWLVAGLVGLGAVYGGFHYATDVVAGALLGGVVGTAMLTIGRTGAAHR